MREFIFLKTKSRYSRIYLDELKYVEAADKYVRFITQNRIYTVLGCLGHVEKHLPGDQFCRIHRSYIVSFRHTEEFGCETVLINGKELPLARQYKNIFYEKAKVFCADGMQVETLEKNNNNLTVSL